MYKQLIIAVWVLFWALWAVLGLNTKTTEKAESGLSRRIHLLVVFAAFALLGVDSLRIGFLGIKLVNSSTIYDVSCVIIILIGLSFAIWGRLQLGSNWSAKITIKKDHTLIKNGPYAIVRHPMYTGILAGVIGTALAVNEIGGLLSAVFIFIAFYRKLKIEEKVLIERFGEEYSDYKKKVKAIIPFII